MMLHLSEQFPSGEVARSFLEDRCRKDTGRQRNYDVICREYAKDSFVEQELEHLMREATDSMKRGQEPVPALKGKMQCEAAGGAGPGDTGGPLASDCPGPVIGRKRDLYYS